MLMTIVSWMINKCCARSQISFQHMIPFWCPFLEPYPTIHHSNFFSPCLGWDIELGTFTLILMWTDQKTEDTEEKFWPEIFLEQLEVLAWDGSLSLHVEKWEREWVVAVHKWQRDCSSFAVFASFLQKRNRWGTSLEWLNDDVTRVDSR